MKIIKAKINGKLLRVKDCRGFASVRGLMFDPLQHYDGALITGNAVWMPFVRQKLDLVFLDEHLKPVEAQKAVPLTLNAKTWRIYRCEGARYCLELKEGIVKNRKIASMKFLF